MKKRIVRLNESDLEKLVRKIIKEDDEMDPNAPAEEGGEEGEEEGHKLVNDFFNKMSKTRQVMIFFDKIADRNNPKPKAEAIVRFAEMIGVPKSKIASIVSDIRDVSKTQ